MTTQLKSREKNLSTLKLWLSVLTILLLIVIIIRSEKISIEIFASIKDTANKVVPTLFPIMIVSRFATDYGLLEYYDKFSASVLNRFFGVSKKAVSAVILGFLSSFPIGTMTVCELYKKGDLSREDAEEALGPSHNTGPAFPICVIGTRLCGNTLIGVYFYVVQVISAIITAKLLVKKTKIASDNMGQKIKHNSIGFSSSLTGAICSSAAGCINIVSFVAFGRLLTDLFSVLVCDNPKIVLIIKSLTEFSSGSSSSITSGGILGFALCSFSICFGGIISILQAASYTSKVGLSIKKCIIFKLFQGSLAVLMTIIGYFFLF